MLAAVTTVWMWAGQFVAEHIWNTQDNLHLIFMRGSNLSICHPWECIQWKMNTVAWTKRLPREPCLQQHTVLQSLTNIYKKQAWLADASFCISSWLLLLSLLSFPNIVPPFLETSCLEISGVESCIWTTVYWFFSNPFSFWVHCVGFPNTLWQSQVQLCSMWKRISLYL